MIGNCSSSPRSAPSTSRPAATPRPKSDRSCGGELCQQIGDPQQLFGIMLGMWEWHLVRGDLRSCVGLAADGMELAEH